MFMRVADWTVSRLLNEGVDKVFFLPGGGAMYLNDALAKNSDIAAVSCHHEQACGIAAEAYGRTGHKKNPGFGVAMVTTGPGATNIITPVTGAWLDSLPMLVLSGQAKSADRINGRSIRQGGVQEVDIVSLVRPVTKFAKTITNPLDIGPALDTALYQMRSGRPGPVWLDIPLDIQGVQLPRDYFSDWSPPKPIPTPAPNIQKICDLIEGARRPIILLGHGVRLACADQKLRSLLEKLGIPAVFTWNALDLLPYDHPLNIGRPGVVAARAPNFAVQNSDLLISIGARLDNIVTAYNPSGFARAAKKIVVDIDAGELKEHKEMNIDYPLQMDALDFINLLLSLPVNSGSESWRERCSDWKRRFGVSSVSPKSESSTISHAAFIHSFSNAAPENTLIAAGSSGLAIEFFFSKFKNKQGQRTFLTSGLGAMGYGLPAAIGACLGNGEKPMIAIESDGSFQLNIQELATVVSLELPICIFIMNNGGYASIRTTQRNYFESRYVGSGPDSGLFIPSVRDIAGAYGLTYFEVCKLETMDEKISEALEQRRPCIVEVQLASDEVLEPKCAAVPSSDGNITSMPLEDMTPLLTLEQLRSEMLIELTEESVSARGRSIRTE